MLRSSELRASLNRPINSNGAVDKSNSRSELHKNRLTIGWLSRKAYKALAIIILLFLIFFFGVQLFKKLSFRNKSNLPIRMEEKLTIIENKIDTIEEKVKDKIIDLGETVKDKIIDVGGIVKDKAVDMGTQVKDKISDLGDKVKDKAIDMGTQVKDKISDLGDKVKDKAIDLGNTVKDKIIDVGDKVKDKAKDKVAEIGEKVKDTMSDIELKVKEKLGDLQDKVKDAISKIRRKDYTQCDECISYEELLRRLDNITDINNYLDGKVEFIANATRERQENVPPSLVGGFEDRKSKLPELEERMKVLLVLNQTLTRELGEALKMEKDMKTLKEEYDLKVFEIEKYKTEAMVDLFKFYNMEKDIAEIQAKRLELTEKMKQKRVKLEKEREEYNLNGIRLRKELESLKAREELKDITDLEKEIKDKEDHIKKLLGDGIEAENQIKEYTIRITELTAKINRYTERIQEIDVNLGQNELISHIEVKIRQFEEISQQFIQLKTDTLAEAKEFIDETIVHLEKLENNVTTSLHLNKGKGLTPFNVAKINATIEAEKSLLLQWIKQQYITLSFTNKDIRENEVNIAQLKQKLKQLIEEQRLTVLMREREEKTTSILTFQKEIEEFNIKINGAKVVIATNQEIISEGRRTVEVLTYIRDKISIVTKELAVEEESLKNKENEIYILQTEFDAYEHSLLDEVKSKERDEEQIKLALKKLTDKMNERIVKKPQLDSIKESIEEYKIRVRQVDDAYNLLLSVFEQIRNLA